MPMQNRSISDQPSSCPHHTQRSRGRAAEFYGIRPVTRKIGAPSCEPLLPNGRKTRAADLSRSLSKSSRPTSSQPGGSAEQPSDACLRHVEGLSNQFRHPLVRSESEEKAW
jgi:hypothetical protein